MKLFIRWVINAFALWAAAALVSGIELSGGWVSILIVAAIFGIINTILKPIVKLFSIPFIILTLGLFSLIINATMLGLTAYLTDALQVDGFWSAVLGSIIISIISTLLNVAIKDEGE